MWSENETSNRKTIHMNNIQGTWWLTDSNFANHSISDIKVRQLTIMAIRYWIKCLILSSFSEHIHKNWSVFSQTWWKSWNKTLLYKTFGHFTQSYFLSNASVSNMPLPTPTTRWLKIISFRMIKNCICWSDF